MENDKNKAFDDVYTVSDECDYCPFTRKPCMKEKCAIADRSGTCSFYTTAREFEAFNYNR